MYRYRYSIAMTVEGVQGQHSASSWDLGTGISFQFDRNSGEWKEVGRGIGRVVDEVRKLKGVNVVRG